MFVGTRCTVLMVHFEKFQFVCALILSVQVAWTKVNRKCQSFVFPFQLLSIKQLTHIMKHSPLAYLRNMNIFKKEEIFFKTRKYTKLSVL